jgi:hypothetical protein
VWVEVRGRGRERGRKRGRGSAGAESEGARVWLRPRRESRHAGVRCNMYALHMDEKDEQLARGAAQLPVVAV